MKSYFAFAILAVLFVQEVPAAPQREGVDCTGKEDGVYGWGCWSYTLCTGGEGELIKCEDGWAFDDELMRCRIQGLVALPCGTMALTTESAEPATDDVEFTTSEDEATTMVYSTEQAEITDAY
ncbi:hypothetical protein CAPTEDRAFT_195795 [Capitella teleta]|uniref:Chitin-binding type-2 domain-containing protein n=1 Tax=Capitella teleta TaxID=283909 RepID=R7UQT8_CAPTE|nr:hypothetical protein CAPTEDRAFT_200764 [Capitella teleta]ELU06938.1 hypothetical protein CAPTEDRAFT_195795 [Capitella teleta]|eukprot:ELU06302.1 hypothetical protein CAPTEDRAFT_200764 [Capitella teleta]